MEKIFHGSDHVIEQPVYGGGKPYNDFGRGFYCTRQRDMACEWAVGHKSDGYVNEYRLDTSGLRVVDLREQPYTLLHWLAVLVQNRQFSLSSATAVSGYRYLVEHWNVDFSEVDVVIGYRADDSYFSFARAFLDGRLSYRGLSQAMRLGDLGSQVVVMSPCAFEAMSFVGAQSVSSAEWFPRRSARDQAARRQYGNLAAEGLRDDDIVMADLVRGKVGLDDARLR